ncbi:MAG: choice-of-anchor J domain-containing protein [Bacteroidales bacterium]
MKRTLQLLVGIMLMAFSTSLIAQTTVTFTIYDLGEQHEEVYIKGSFNEWTNTLMDEIDPGVWRFTFTGIPEGSYEWGAVNQDDGWLISGDNRTFEVTAEGNVVGQVAYYIAAPGDIDVTFNIDMNEEIDAGNFLVGTDVLEIVGGVNGWPGELVPEEWQPTDDNADGIYTLTTPAVYNEGEVLEFKFRLNGDWDTNEFPGPQPNRTYKVRAENNIYDAVYGTYMFDPDYMEDFNDIEPADPDEEEPVVYSPPASWVVLDEDGDGYSWEFRMTAEEDGYPISHSAIEEEGGGYIALTPDNWLITPPVNLLGYEEAEEILVKFKVAASASTAAYTEEKYKVVLAEENTVDPADFTNELWVETLGEEAGEYNYLEREIDITAHAGNQIRIAFVHFDCTDMDRLSIEDVEVVASFGDPVTYTVSFDVEDQEATEITDASIMLHDYMYAPGHYDIEGMVENTYNYSVHKYGYDVTEGNVEVSDATATEGVVSVSTVLTALPDYTVTFTVTDDESNPVEGATITIGQMEEVTDTDGIATFSLVDGEYGYLVSIEGYDPATGDVIVEGADTSVDVELVTATSVGTESINTIALYPNPATEYFNVASTNQIRSIRVINVTGQEVINISNVNAAKHTVNTSELNNGIYIVSVTDINGFTKSSRIVKR